MVQNIVRVYANFESSPFLYLKRLGNVRIKRELPPVAQRPRSERPLASGFRVLKHDDIGSAVGSHRRSGGTGGNDESERIQCAARLKVLRARLPV